MAPTIRTFTEGDIAFALEQTAREGWDATTELFEACLAHDLDGGFIAETETGRVGMVTTTRHDRTGWIGNLIVPPENRKQGIGGGLMTHAMAHLAGQGVRTVRLEADPPGVRLYRRLGFVDEFESLRFQLPAGRVDQGRCEPAVPARMTAADLPAVTAFDVVHFGDHRERLLKLLFQQARAAYCLRDGGKLSGYAFVVPSRLGVRLGPFVAADRRDAELLLQTVLADWCESTILLAVPCLNADAINLFESRGFERKPSCCRMIHGKRVAAGQPEHIFAIANGAMG